MIKLQELIATRLGTSVWTYNNDLPQGNMVKALLGCCLNSNIHQPFRHVNKYGGANAVFAG